MLWLLLLFILVIAFGVWREFTAIQWIWLLVGSAIGLLVLWFIVLAFFIGPEMIRTGPPGG